MCLAPFQTATTIHYPTVVNLIKHCTIVIDHTRVVLTRKCPYYNSRVVIYALKMFKRLSYCSSKAWSFLLTIYSGMYGPAFYWTGKRSSPSTELVPKTVTNYPHPLISPIFWKSFGLSWKVWSDLANFRRIWPTFKIIWQFLQVYLAFGKILMCLGLEPGAAGW